jgi:hypothetical protein
MCQRVVSSKGQQRDLFFVGTSWSPGCGWTTAGKRLCKLSACCLLTGAESACEQNFDSVVIGGCLVFQFTIQKRKD